MKRLSLLLVVLGLTGCHENPLSETPASDAGTADAVTPGGDTGLPNYKQCEADSDCATLLGELPACQLAVCDPTTAECKKVAADDGTNCDDNNPCSSEDRCNGGACTGAPKTCNDNNQCTNDFCDPMTGQCTGNPNSANCDDGSFCTTNDRCTNGECKGEENPKCECQTDDDCAHFDDADLCNGVLICQDNQCITKPGSAVVCDQGNAAPCTTLICNPALGQCRPEPLVNGDACDDGSFCSKNDACQAGACKGEPVVCQDDNACTMDSCEPVVGCVFANHAEACDDGDLCTLNDACDAGKCTGAANPECDGCTTMADCAVFEDGDICNGTLKCDAGSCVVDTETVVSCSGQDAQPCSVVSCKKTSGECVAAPALDGAACDDGSACTTSDHCESGACVSNPVACEDDNACTTDDCDPASGCTFTNSTDSCDDGNACTIDDVCGEGACAGSGDCSCETTADCTPFEDGNACNGTLECNPDDKCVPAPGTQVSCPGSDNPCLNVTCVPETGDCQESAMTDGAGCDDDSACTTADVCSDGLCGGTKVNCNDGNVCTDDSCQKSVGCVQVNNATACDDGVVCTTGDACSSGSCSGSPTVECACDTDADCAGLDDGNLCNGTLVCSANKCIVDPETVVVCMDAGDQECATISCNPGNGQCEATNTEDGKLCDDTDACTLGDACLTGQCVSDESLGCNDNNVCTSDICLPAVGCIFEATGGGACDDGDACTDGDTCGDGVCQPGTNTCNDVCAPAFSLTCGSFDFWGTDKSGATNVVTEYASCSPFEYPGPEYTYLLTAPSDSKVTVTLSSETSATDVMLLKQGETGCDPKACQEYGFTTATATIGADETWYVVVDGFFDEPGDYQIEIDCVPTTESNCADGLDEDADDLTDCEDPDCSDADACQAPSCTPEWVLECGSTDAWGNAQFGSTDVIEAYSGCDNPWTYGGPEYTYTFDSPVTGSVTVSLSNETAATDVIILEAGAEGQCAPDTCIAYGLPGATFQAVAGTTYHIVVDGFNNSEGTYTIDIACPSGVETDCSDGVDDDMDGQTDCGDSDCAELAECQNGCLPPKGLTIECGETLSMSNADPEHSKNNTTEYSCEPGFDHASPEVAATFVAPFDGEVTLTLDDDGADTDVFIIADSDGQCDSAAECIAFGADSATFQATAGTTYYVIVDGLAGAVVTFDLTMACTPTVETNCTDGLDDDSDGMADCLDSDCFGSSDACQPACQPDTFAADLLTCPDSTDSFTNDGTGSTNAVAEYGCNVFSYADAPEYVYEFIAPEAGTYTVTLTEESEDTDVLLLKDEGLGCNPASCKSWGFDSATFTADEANETWYIVIDGFDGAIGSYDLAFSCGG